MNFKEGRWNNEINVTDFVKTNITSYEGDASFLVGPTERTKAVWNKCLEALAEERANNGVRSLDPSTVSTITSFAPGYIDKDNEVIVGLQTDELLRRAIKPFGGIKVVEKACRENGVEVEDEAQANTGITLMFDEENFAIGKDIVKFVNETAFNNYVANNETSIMFGIENTQEFLLTQEGEPRFSLTINYSKHNFFFRDVSPDQIDFMNYDETLTFTYNSSFSEADLENINSILSDSRTGYTQIGWVCYISKNDEGELFYGGELNQNTLEIYDYLNDDESNPYRESFAWVNTLFEEGFVYGHYDMYLYAVWEPNSYDITYEYDKDDYLFKFL